MTLHRRTFLKQLGLGVGALGFVSSFPGTFTGAAALLPGKLPRSTPEDQGVRSKV